jgi:hypothetical protein
MHDRERGHEREHLDERTVGGSLERHLHETDRRRDEADRGHDLDLRALEARDRVGDVLLKRLDFVRDICRTLRSRGGRVRRLVAPRSAEAPRAAGSSR